MSDKVWFSKESASRLIENYVGPLVSGSTVEFEGSEVVIWRRVLKWECVNNGTSVNFDLK